MRLRGLILFASVVLACGAPLTSVDGGVPELDAGNRPVDAGIVMTDSGVADSGAADSGVVDSGIVDSGVVDSGVVDSGVVDSGVVDAGALDADGGDVDAGSGDAGALDAGELDGGAFDAGADAGASDAGTDAGRTYGPENVATVGFPDASVPVSLSIDRTRLGTLVTAAEQRAIVLQTVDLNGPLANGLNQLRNACGTAHQLDVPNPTYDCSLTTLGQTFIGPDGTARTSGELVLVRALTLTPANAQFAGTTLSGVADIANNLGIGGGASQVLADTLGIARTSPIVTTTNLADALRIRFVATHPAVDGGVDLTLSDVLANLNTWGPKLGPIAGGHPGLLDPASPVSAQVLTNSFSVNVTGTSHVLPFGAVDLSQATPATFQRAVVPTGRPANELVEWQLSATDLAVAGLAPSSSANLMLRIPEAPTFVPACTGSPCQTNQPSIGTMGPWAVPMTRLEYVVAQGAARQYAFRRVALSYALGSFNVNVGQGTDPAGWSAYTSAFGVGNPPAPHFVWEAMGELLQVAMHRPSGVTLAEGQANARLPVSANVRVSSTQMANALAPVLAMKTAALEALSVGPFSTTNPDVDVFVARADDGVARLAFVNAQDPRPTATYGYTNPGFFSDEALSLKVSTPTVLHAGETPHEAVALMTGVQATYFVTDQTGAVFRVKVTLALDGASVTLRWAQQQ